MSAASFALGFLAGVFAMTVWVAYMLQARIKLQIPRSPAAFKERG